MKKKKNGSRKVGRVFHVDEFSMIELARLKFSLLHCSLDTLMKLL